MSQGTLSLSDNQILIPVPERAVGKLQLLLSRPVELRADGLVVVETGELGALLGGYIPVLTGPVQIPDSVKEQAAEADAANAEAVLAVEELLRHPYLLLLGEVDWNRRLVDALRPGSPTYVGRDLAAQAAALVLELSYSGDSDELVAAARAALEED